MYTIKKTFVVSAAHSLTLSYESKCENLHGHNWKITVTIMGPSLDENGMLMDFSHIKLLVNSKFDHSNLNNLLDQPTAENISKYLCDSINKHLQLPSAKCVRVEVEETDGSYASYDL